MTTQHNYTGRERQDLILRLSMENRDYVLTTVDRALQDSVTPRQAYLAQTALSENIDPKRAEAGLSIATGYVSRLKKAFAWTSAVLSLIGACTVSYLALSAAKYFPRSSQHTEESVLEPPVRAGYDYANDQDTHKSIFTSNRDEFVYPMCSGRVMSVAATGDTSRLEILCDAPKNPIYATQSDGTKVPIPGTETALTVVYHGLSKIYTLTGSAVSPISRGKPLGFVEESKPFGVELYGLVDGIQENITLRLAADPPVWRYVPLEQRCDLAGVADKLTVEQGMVVLDITPDSTFCNVGASLKSDAKVPVVIPQGSFVVYVDATRKALDAHIGTIPSDSKSDADVRTRADLTLHRDFINGLPNGYAHSLAASLRVKPQMSYLAGRGSVYVADQIGSIAPFTPASPAVAPQPAVPAQPRVRATPRPSPRRADPAVERSGTEGGRSGSRTHTPPAARPSPPAPAHQAPADAGDGPAVDWSGE